MKNRIIVLIMVVLVLLFVQVDMACAFPFGALLKNGGRYVDDLGRTVLKKTNRAARLTVMHADDLARVASTYGDDVARIAGKYGDDAIRFLGTHGDDGVKVIQKYGDDVFRLSGRNKARLVKLDGKYSKTVVRKALAQGDEGIKNLARRVVQTGKKGTLRKGLDSLFKFVKKHPIVVLITGVVAASWDKIITTAETIAVVGTIILGLMILTIVSGFFPGKFINALKKWRYALKKMKETPQNMEDNPDINKNGNDNNESGNAVVDLNNA